MPIVKTPIPGDKVARLDFICSCGGKMNYLKGGSISRSFPATFEHLCGKCGDKAQIAGIYPALEYKGVRFSAEEPNRIALGMMHGGAITGAHQ